MKYKIGNSTATLIIKLDNGNKPVFAGGRVSGRVCLSIDAAVSNQHRKDHQLTIEVEGKEKALVRDGPKSSKASRSLLSLKPKLITSIADADGSLHSMQPGQHEFPFEFDLPRGLPSTMRCDSGNSCCEIKYKIKAWVENKKKRQGDNNVVHRVRGLGLSQGLLEVKRELLVLAAPHPPETVPWNMEPVTFEIKTFGVVRQGFVSFGVRLLDTHVSKGDAIQVYFACRNTSTEMEIEWMEMTLWEMVEWTVPKRFGLFGAGRKSRRVLANQRFTLSAPSMEFMDSMGSNISVASSMARTVREETHIRNRQNIYADLQREKNRFSIRVPLETTDTYSGKLVTCTHSLEVKVKTSNMMQDPRVEIPLRLLTYLPNNFGSNRHSVVVSTRFSLASQVSQVSEATQPDSTEPEEEEQGQSERSVERSTRQQEPTAAAEAADTTQTEEQVAGEEEQLQEEETNQQDDDDESNNNNNRDDSSTRIERFHAITSIRSIVMYQNNSSLSTGDAPDGLDDETVSAQSYASSLWSGDTTTADEEDSDTELPDQRDDPVPSSNDVPSIQDLLMEMLMSTQDYEIISTKLEIPEWRDILAKLQPDELGSIVAHVNLDFDQPKVAALLANHMVESDAVSFTCQYCREALLNTAQWNRITMVQRLLPFCSDLRTHRNVLTEKLTAWELTVVADDFGRLLHNHNNKGHEDAVAIARREALNDPPKESW